MSTVLVIDDDRSVLHLVTKALQNDDIRVRTAPTAAEGLKAVAESPPDIVLLDIFLPHVSGLDVFRQIQHLLDQ